jgi:hypothetical protein
MDEELAAWPLAARGELRAQYSADSGDPIGTRATNGLTYGSLHDALRNLLPARLKTPGNKTGFAFADLLDHPTIRYRDDTQGSGGATIRTK